MASTQDVQCPPPSQIIFRNPSWERKRSSSLALPMYDSIDLFAPSDSQDVRHEFTISNELTPRNSLTALGPWPLKRSSASSSTSNTVTAVSRDRTESIGPWPLKRLQTEPVPIKNVEARVSFLQEQLNSPGLSKALQKVDEDCAMIERLERGEHEGTELQAIRSGDHLPPSPLPDNGRLPRYVDLGSPATTRFEHICSPISVCPPTHKSYECSTDLLCVQPTSLNVVNTLLFFMSISVFITPASVMAIIRHHNTGINIEWTLVHPTFVALEKLSRGQFSVLCIALSWYCATQLLMTCMTMMVAKLKACTVILQQQIPRENVENFNTSMRVYSCDRHQWTKADILVTFLTTAGLTFLQTIVCLVFIAKKPF